MGRNIKAQLFHCIDDNCAFGSKKRTATPEERQGNIYSYKYMNNLKDIAANFYNYTKTYCPDLKMVKDIRKEDVMGFLAAKEKEGVSASTLTAYRAGMEKLGYLAQQTYNINADFTSCNFVPHKREKIRDIAMSPEDYNSFLEATQNSTCKSHAAVIVCREFGLRVSEVVNITPQDIKSGELHIEQSKGGRNRDIPVTKDSQVAALNMLKNAASDLNGPILDIKPDSINKYLRENLERAGIDKYTNAKTGIHAIRKMYAEERYQEELDKGFDHKEAWGNVCQELGHGRNREDLFVAYCPNYA